MGTIDQAISDLRTKLAESLTKSRASVEPPSTLIDWSPANKERRRNWVIRVCKARRYRADLRRQIRKAVVVNPAFDESVVVLNDQFAWHRKPTGWSGAPCPVCGCPAKNLRARHRALKADEVHEWRALWVKRIRVCFGTDFSDEPIRE